MIDYLDFFEIYVMGGLEMSAGFCFLTGFLQRKIKPLYSILFAVFGMAVLVIFRMEGIWAFLVFILLLTAAGKLVYRADLVSAALCAVVFWPVKFFIVYSVFCCF